METKGGKNFLIVLKKAGQNELDSYARKICQRLENGQKKLLCN